MVTKLSEKKCIQVQMKIFGVLSDLFEAAAVSDVTLSTCALCFERFSAASAARTSSNIAIYSSVTTALPQSAVHLTTDNTGVNTKLNI